jgi:hypothetical protein
MTISSLHNQFLNKQCIILGCGESATQYKQNENIFSIGVNDIGQITNPDLLLLVDPRKKFIRDASEERVSNIEKTVASYYVVMDNTWEFDKKYTFRLGLKESLRENLDNNDKLNYSLDSPYIAINLAYKMGFRKIGLLGIDYTKNHFYKQDGDHSLVKLNYLNKIQQNYFSLYNVMLKNKTHIYNLSQNSLLTGIPKIKYEDFVNETLCPHCI